MKKLILISLVLGLGLELNAQQASADFYWNTLLTPVIESSNPGSLTSTESASTKTSGFGSSTTVGAALGGRFILGGTLNYNSASAKTEATAATTEIGVKDLEVGPAVGLHTGHFYLQFAYFLMAHHTESTKVTNSTDVSIKYKGNGYQATIGYNFSVGKAFSIGPALAYRNLSYSKIDTTDNVTAANSTTDVEYQATKKSASSLDPMISLMFIF
jgi:hypothetical protein